jgi:hypothetical protein
MIMRTKLFEWITRGITGLRELGPYALVELVVPGGSVLAVLIWLYRRHKREEALRT